MCFSLGIGKGIDFQRGSKGLSAGGGVLNSLAKKGEYYSCWSHTANAAVRKATASGTMEEEDAWDVEAPTARDSCPWLIGRGSW